MKKMKKVPPRVKVIATMWDPLREYHTSFPLCLEGLRKLEKGDELNLVCPNQGDAWRLYSLIVKVFGIPGVRRISISPYILRIERSRAVLWEEIESYLPSIIKETFEFSRLQFIGLEEEIQRRKRSPKPRKPEPKTFAVQALTNRILKTIRDWIGRLRKTIKL